jgi:peptidoglycan/LPS O-acetylase OafA/YrhL
MRPSFVIKEEQAGELLRFSKGAAILLIAFHHFARSLWLARGLPTPNLMQWVFNPSGENFRQIVSYISAGQWDDAIHSLSAQFGYFGVHLFVLMSGLGLAFGTSSKVEPGPFLKRRFRKLVPPFWTAVVFWTAWRIIIEQPYSFREIVERASLLSTFDQTNFFRVDPPLWCMAVFFQLYLLFLPLRYIIRRFGPRMILLFAAVAFMARWICMLPAISGWNENFGHVLGLDWLAVFGMGIWAGDKLRNEGRLVISVPAFSVVTASGVVLLALSERSRAVYPIHDSAIAVVIGGATLLVWKCISGGLVCRGLAAVGAVSFPMYLYHRPLIGVVVFLWRNHSPDVVTMGGASLGILTIFGTAAVFLVLRRIMKPKIAALALGSEPWTRPSELGKAAVLRSPTFFAAEEREPMPQE